MRSALQMYFEHARTKTSCCLSTSALHSQTSKIHSLVSGIILPLTFSSWKFPCPSLRWHRPWASIQAPALSNLVLVRAVVTVPSRPQICKAPFSVLRFGLKPPDSLYKLLNHMVAGLGTVGLKLNLWHEVKIKRKEVSLYCITISLRHQGCAFDSVFSQENLASNSKMLSPEMFW